MLTQTHAIACDRCGRRGPWANTIEAAKKAAEGKLGMKTWEWTAGKGHRAITLCAACAGRELPTSPPAVATCSS